MKKTTLILLAILSISSCSTNGGHTFTNKSDDPLIGATTLLLDFKQHKAGELEKAIELVNKHEEPEHYEEWGKIDDKRYFYTKDIYKNAGIIIHKYDNKITNIERY